MSAKLKVIFLDRDGVINEYPGDLLYVTKLSEFKLLPGAKQAIKKLNDNGCPIFIISNQAGVGKGIYSQESLDRITECLVSELKGVGAKVDGVYYCTHRNEDNCNCRKPKTGNVEAALKKIKSGSVNDLECFFVGDTIRDIETGKSANCKTVLVFSGKEKPQNKDTWSLQPDFTASNLSEAVNLILRE